MHLCSGFSSRKGLPPIVNRDESLYPVLVVLLNVGMSGKFSGTQDRSSLGTATSANKLPLWDGCCCCKLYSLPPIPPCSEYCYVNEKK